MSTSDQHHRSDPGSAKHCIREHHDENANDNNREKPPIEDIPLEEVHTANNWENADLGDEQRKQKFLRLMGAKKRTDDTSIDHHEPVCEKQHCRSTTQNESIDRELEKQFNSCLQAQILHVHHEGFGFSGSDAPTSLDAVQPETGRNFIRATTDTNTSKDPSASGGEKTL